MAEIVTPDFEVGLIVGVAPDDGIVAAKDSTGALVVLEAWDTDQGDAYHYAPAGSHAGGGTRRHLFDREVYVDSGGAVYVNVRAWGSITGKPTTVAGYGITDAITTAGGQTIGGTLATSDAITITTNAKYFTGKTTGAAAKKLIGVNASNLVAVDVDALGVTFGAGGTWAGNVAPGTDNAYDSGSASFRWKNGYFAGTISTAGIISTTATAGSFTSTGTSTASRYVLIGNTTGLSYFGTNGASGVATGGTAYATIIGSDGALPVELFTNSATRLSISSAGAFDFKSNSVSGIGSLGLSGTVSAVGSAASLYNYLAVTGTTTGAQYQRLTNSSADVLFGIEGSAGAQLMTGSSPYATVLNAGANGTTPILQLGAGSQLFFTYTKTGLGTGTAVFSNGTAVSGITTLATSGLVSLNAGSGVRSVAANNATIVAFYDNVGGGVGTEVTRLRAIAGVMGYTLQAAGQSHAFLASDGNPILTLNDTSKTSVFAGPLSGITSLTMGGALATSYSSDSRISIANTNTSAGTSAGADFILTNDASKNLQLVQWGSGNTGGTILGVARANNSFLLAGGALTIGTTGATSVVLGTNGATNLTIASGGAITVTGSFSGTTGTFSASLNGSPVVSITNTDGTAPIALGLTGGGSTTAPLLDVTDTDAGVATDVMVRFVRNGSTAGSITTTLALVTAYNTTSDERLKRDLGAVPALILGDLRVRYFERPLDGSREIGVFAQEAYAITRDKLPHFITPGTDEVDDRGVPLVPWQADYSKLVPELVLGWQDHAAQIADVINDIRTLRSRVDAIEQRA